MSDMYQAMLDFPKQFLQSWEIASSVELGLEKKKYNRILLTGLGGSSLPGDILNDYLSPQIRIELIRDYDLPENLTSDDLIFISSYSGNTEETLENFNQALEQKLNIVVIVHGGKLKELAIENNIPYIQIPACVQPRSAAGNFFSSMIWVLDHLDIIGFDIQEFEKLEKFLIEQKPRYHDYGEEIGNFLLNKTPIIFGPAFMESTSRIWKVKVTENTKTAGFYNVFPEVNHNEMVGYTRKMIDIGFIFLRSQFMRKRIKQRMIILKQLLEEQYSVRYVDLKGENLLQELFDGILLADYVTLHMAKIYGVDPAPVPMIEDFKVGLKALDQEGQDN